MPRRPSASSRWLTAATWPVGVALTSWDYMWRTTPMRRTETVVDAVPEGGIEPVDGGVSTEEVQPPESGVGPLFHRRYSTLVRDAEMSAEELMTAVKANLNRVAPTTF